MALLVVCLAIFVMNLPFGAWRFFTKKFSIAWFISIHAPIPLIGIIRNSLDVDLTVVTASICLGFFVLGQLSGRIIASKTVQPQVWSTITPLKTRFFGSLFEIDKWQFYDRLFNTVSSQVQAIENILYIMPRLDHHQSWTIYNTAIDWWVRIWKINWEKLWVTLKVYLYHLF